MASEAKIEAAARALALAYGINPDTPTYNGEVYRLASGRHKNLFCLFGLRPRPAWEWFTEEAEKAIGAADGI